MPINFHSEQNRQTYASRSADEDWKAAIRSIVDVRDKKVADIGCGGGIYGRALADMGAAHVTCIDWSQVMLDDAQHTLAGYQNVSFVRGHATQTGVPANQFDMVLERALIHHLHPDELLVYFTEAVRVLKPGGILVVQDRTAEDCLLPGSRTHIRGYFFTYFPHLVELEVDRRHSSSSVTSALRQVGLYALKERKLWETRKIHCNFSVLADDLLARTGRSILHELTGEELHDLVNYIQHQVDNLDQPFIEQDQWTIWSAVR